MELLDKIITERKEKSIDDKFSIASNKVILAKSYNGGNSAIPSNNERFFSGALASSMNAVFDDGFTALHQGCLGQSATHSDLSVCCFKPKPQWPIPLLVGEGKRSSESLRDDTRGQLLNELLRHRSIEFGLNSGNVGYFGPILLVTFAASQLEIDLAFPSTKGGQLDRDDSISFESTVTEKTEVFWTVRLLRVSIHHQQLARRNLAIVLQFLSTALKKLDQWQAGELPHVQFKVPMPLPSADSIAHAKCYNDNVSILTMKHSRMFVFKEYCYNLRQKHSVLIPTIQISDVDQRKPPPEDLLKCPGPPYSTTGKVHCKPLCGSVLKYDFIKGSSSNPTASGWLQILQQISNMHKDGYVHGDLLPRNVLFSGKTNGYVIDFDLSRKEKENYVLGFNWEDFEQFRHPDAKPLKPMEKIHDIHSLCQISCHFFIRAMIRSNQARLIYKGSFHILPQKKDLGSKTTSLMTLHQVGKGNYRFFNMVDFQSVLSWNLPIIRPTELQAK